MFLYYGWTKTLRLLLMVKCFSCAEKFRNHTLPLFMVMPRPLWWAFRVWRAFLNTCYYIFKSPSRCFTQKPVMKPISGWSLSVSICAHYGRTSETNFAHYIALSVSRGVNGAPAGLISHLRAHCLQLCVTSLSHSEPLLPLHTNVLVLHFMLNIFSVDLILWRQSNNSFCFPQRRELYIEPGMRWCCYRTAFCFIFSATQLLF